MAETTTKAPFLFRVSKSRSKHLLVVNKGPDAVTIPREGKKWDLLEIYFVPSEIEKIVQNPSLTNAEHVVFESDRSWRKFRVMKKVFETSHIWRNYKSIMFADDDLLPVGCTIAEIFKLFSKTGCRIGQPALTQDSPFSWMITIKNNNFVWRKTNFVEIMCPIMTQEAIHDYSPLFDDTVTNWGLDFYWGYHEWKAGRALAILDSTPVRHCRPVGGGVAYQGLETSPFDDRDAFTARHDLPIYSFRCLGGVVDPKLSRKKQRLEEMMMLGLSLSGYDNKFFDDARFLSSYVKREIAACK